jgi:threonine dehydratase
MQDAVRQTLLARVYDVASETPLERANKLSKSADCDVYLKREDLQPVHSFKLRGAYNKMCQLSPAERANGVIAASAGNHAQGVALAAQRLGISALIVMPSTTPSIKVDAVRAYDGVVVELAGDSYSDAADYSNKRAEETGRTYVHPFDDPLVIAGQGTIGREILEQLEGVTHIFVPVGGGGLIAGIAQYVKSLRPEIRVISVEPEDSNVMQLSLQANRRISLHSVGIFADGVAVKQLGENTFRIARKLVDDCITVNTDEICAAIKTVFEETRSIVEPAGALGVAGITKYAESDKLHGAKAVAICSGANMTFERLQFVAERTLMGSNREILLAVELAEEPTALQQLCERVINGRNITQFCYRLRERDKAHVILGVNVENNEDHEAFNAKLKDAGYTFTDLTNEDTAKEHVRYMVGGAAPNAKNEHFYTMQFPQRPMALDEFLRTISGTWNVSLFHYRGQGGDMASVLIGFEAPNRQQLELALRQTAYQYERVDTALSVQIFNQ